LKYVEERREAGAIAEPGIASFPVRCPIELCNKTASIWSIDLPGSFADVLLCVLLLLAGELAQVCHCLVGGRYTI
jgi:hypothetical protein